MFGFVYLPFRKPVNVVSRFRKSGADAYPRLEGDTAYLQGTEIYKRAVRAATNTPLEGEAGIRTRDELVELRNELRRKCRSTEQRRWLNMYDEILKQTEPFVTIAANDFAMR